MLQLRAKNGKYIGTIIISLIICSIIGAVAVTLHTSQRNKKVEAGHTKWTVYISDGSKKTYVGKYDDITDIRLGSNVKGKRLICSCELTKIDPDESYVVETRVRRTAFEAYLDGSRIFEYALKRYKNGEMVGYGRFLINMPSVNEGQTIKIVFYAAENNAFSRLYNPVIYCTTTAYDYFSSENICNILLCSFMLMFGLLTLIIGCVQILFNSNFRQCIYIGVFSILMGLYVSCNQYIMQLVSADVLLNTYLEYYAMYLLPVPITLFIMDFYKENGIKNTITMITLCTADIIGTAIVAILNFFNIIHPNEVLAVFHLLYVVMMVFLFFANKGTNRSISQKIFILGYVVLCGATVMDILAYNINVYLGIKMGISSYLMSFGGMMFIGCLFLSYMIKFLYEYKTSVETNALMKLAYTDSMTGLYNRAKAEQTFIEISNKGELYTIVNFDLNYLKRTNDTFGHRAGDDLLIGFSAILKKAFEKAGTMYRMGGDEFMVLTDNSPYSIELKNAFITMNQLIDKENKKKNLYNTEVAYGYACSDEFEHPTYDKVFSLADKRMYEMKIELKSEKTSK